MATSPATFDPNREDTDEALAALSFRAGAVPWDSRPLVGAAESGSARSGPARQREQISERFFRSQAVQQIDAIQMPAPTLLAENREATRDRERERQAPRPIAPEGQVGYATQDDAWLISPLAASSPPAHALRRSVPQGVPRVQMPQLPTVAAGVAASEARRSATIPISPMPQALDSSRVWGLSLVYVVVASLLAGWVAALLAMVVNTR